MLLHVYGVADAGSVNDGELEGLRGERVRQVVSHGLTALVSPVPDDVQVGRKDLLAHAHVLEQLTETTTVLPMQFGMALAGEDQVREHVVDADHPRLRDLLESLDGTVQLTVKGYHEEEPALREVLRRSPEVEEYRRRMASMPQEATYYQRIQFGERIAGLLARLRAEDAALIHERLAPMALRSAEDEATATHQVTNAAFLVRRETRPTFDQAVAGLAEELASRLRLRYVGPQPPYAFVDRPVGEPAWA